MTSRAEAPSYDERHRLTRRLAADLAGSLATEVWTAPSIRAHVRRRLPAPWAIQAQTLGQRIAAAYPGSAAPSRQRLAAYLARAPEVEGIAERMLTEGVSPNPILPPYRFRPIPAFDGLDIPALETEAALADHLWLTPDQLIRFSDLKGLSNRTDNAFAPHYRYRLHPKRSGGLRLIEEPKPLLKRLQRRILSSILAKVPAHPAAFGFVTGRSCIEAAAKHAGEAMVVTFDLRAHFTTVRRHRVYGLFRALGYPYPVARHLSGLTTVATPPHVMAAHGRALHLGLSFAHLPQGAPTSPALANLTAFTLDQRLSGLARRLGASYTRYADDLAFSGDRGIAKALLAAVPEIVADEGFTLNRAKTRAQSAAQRQTITGLTVNRHINIPRDAYDRLRATLHRIATTDDPRANDPAARRSLDGRIAWVERVNPGKGARLRRQFDALPPL